jgi:hypothetical protein
LLSLALWNERRGAFLPQMKGPTENKMAVKVDAPRQTVSLISIDKVKGTACMAQTDRKTGSVQRVVIDKMNGKGRVRGYFIRRVPRHGRGLLSFAVGQPDL